MYSAQYARPFLAYHSPADAALSIPGPNQTYKVLAGSWGFLIAILEYYMMQLYERISEQAYIRHIKIEKLTPHTTELYRSTTREAPPPGPSDR